MKSSKFTGSIHRALKYQKTIYLGMTSLIKQLNAVKCNNNQD